MEAGFHASASPSAARSPLCLAVLLSARPENAEQEN
jgi:hypothetical protein